ncbi:2-keto-3-deoxygalactonate kinase [Rhizobium sp. RU36D]|nr:2-keto-3-deoxygalactonate kinase [Rhizobium sp. RU36D]
MSAGDNSPVTGAAFAALADWGTSNFRLWLVDRSGAVLAERQSGEGMGTIANPAGFSDVLEGHLQALAAPVGLPVAIAGMAGARTGWIEAPYLTAPADLRALYQGAVRAPSDHRKAFILPGVCQREPLPYDVMRGEETQLAGAVFAGKDSGLFCMPGTHSKWVLLNQGVIEQFATVMTGELFDLISKQSILRLSMAGAERSGAEHPAFVAAAKEAMEPGFSITARLFSIRASGLLSGATATDAAARLSGLLIGAEVAAMRHLVPTGGTVRIVASESLTGLYSAALAASGLSAEPLDGSALVRSGLFAAATALFANQNTDV